MTGGRLTRTNGQLAIWLLAVLCLTRANSALAQGKSVGVVVERVSFTGNDKISAGRLAKVIAHWLHRPLTLADLDKMAEAVGAYYRTQGFMVAQAYVPPQTIDGGVVKVSVLEGRFSDIELSTNASRIASERLLRTARLNACGRSAGCTDVGPVMQADIERAALLVSEIPGVTATYQLKAGKEPGSTSIVLDVKRARRFSGSASLDNEGFAYTGRNRLTLTGNAANLTGRGDLTAFSATYAGGGFYSFSGDSGLPLGYGGDRAGVTASHLRYALGREFAPLQASGLADTAGVYVTHPVRRTLSDSIDLRLDLQGRKIQSDIGATGGQSREAASVVLLTLSGSRLDHWLRTGSSQWRLSWSYGNLRLQDESSKAFDAASARTRGRFDKLAYSLRREELIVPGLSVFASLTGQWTARNLDPSEKIGLAGPAAVRAYSSGAVSADKANILTVESRIALPQRLWSGAQLAVAPFYDRAWATYSASPWPTYAGPRDGTYAGGGAYVSLTVPGRYSVRATWALRDGAQPAPARDAASQVWVEAAAAF